MTVDIVVVTYQSVETIRACLAPLPPEASVVVVDNASSDGTAEAAEAMGVRVERRDANYGFAASANHGARWGDGEFILFLNPDAVIDATNLGNLTQALRDDPSLAVVGPQLFDRDGTPQRSAWPFPSPRRSWAEAVGWYRLARDEPDEQFVVGACFLVRRSVFEALGGFDEQYWLYGEEADLCRRAIDAGWRCHLVSEAHATHVGGASGEGEPEVVFEHFQRGAERFIEQRQGPRGLFSHRAAVLAGSLLRLGAMRVRPRGSATRARRRAMVRRLVRVRAARVPSAARDTSGGGDLVVCSLEAWDDVWRRNQFLVRELLNAQPQRRVLFVEPAIDRLRSRSHGGRVPGLRRSPINPRVKLLTPTKVLPRVLNPWADAGLARQVRHAARRVGLDQPTLWLNDSVYTDLLRTQWASVYDITDDWLLAATTPRERRRRQRREAQLLAEADEVVVCSPELARTRGRTRPVALIPNAVDAEDFQHVHARPRDLPTGKVALYVGTLHEDRLDVGLVEFLAARLPDLNIVLVGPNALSEDSRDRLAGSPRITCVGPRPYSDVPAYYQHADVVIVPHVVTPFTDSLDPIKRYECIAAGRPTVATPVAGFVGAGEPIRVASGDDFVAAVTEALTIKTPARSSEPLPSWRSRAADFAGVLERAARRRRARPLRVLYLDHCAQMSGGEIALARLIEALDGVDATVLLAEDGPLVERLRRAEAAVEVLPFPERSRGLERGRVGGRLPVAAVWDTVRYSATLARRIRQLQPDLVHTNSLKSGVYGTIAARLARVPVLWHVHDRLAADYMPAAAARLMRILVSTLPTAAVANSRSTAATIGRNVPVVYCATPPITRHPKPPGRRPVIGIVGRIAPWKGQDVFLKAVALVRRVTDVEGVIVGSAMFGEDAYDAELHRLAAELDLEDHIRFTGFVADMDLVWSELDMLVLASTAPEPFGQVVIEGMAAGLPVIAANAGGPAEVITDGVDGVLYEMGNAEALAQAIVRVLGDADVRESLAAGASRRSQDFTPERTARQMMALYRSVAAASR